MSNYSKPYLPKLAFSKMREITQYQSSDSSDNIHNYFNVWSPHAISEPVSFSPISFSPISFHNVSRNVSYETPMNNKSDYGMTGGGFQQYRMPARPLGSLIQARNSPSRVFQSVRRPERKEVEQHSLDLPRKQLCDQCESPLLKGYLRHKRSVKKPIDQSSLSTASFTSDSESKTRGHVSSIFNTSRDSSPIKSQKPQLPKLKHSSSFPPLSSEIIMFNFEAGSQEDSMKRVKSILKKEDKAKYTLLSLKKQTSRLSIRSKVATRTRMPLPSPTKINKVRFATNSK